MFRPKESVTIAQLLEQLMIVGKDFPSRELLPVVLVRLVIVSRVEPD
jgi:hypothetical protein